MRRLAVVLFVATGGFMVLGTPVLALPDANLNREVSGPFSGTESFDFGTGGCSFVHQVFDATYQPDRPGSGSFHIDVCVELPGPVFPVNGTFQLTAHNGATLTGTVTGTITGTGPPIAPLDFTLTVTEGTKQFQHVTGTVTLDGIWIFDDPVGNVISGTLSGSLQR